LERSEREKTVEIFWSDGIKSDFKIVKKYGNISLAIEEQKDMNPCTHTHVTIYLSSIV